MRKVLLLALFLGACAKKEAPPADTTPAAPPPPPPPAALTAADVSGTWNGTSKVEGDTTTNMFTVTSLTDSTSTVTLKSTNTKVAVTTKFDADSMIVTSQPYKDPGMPKGTPNVIFRAVGRRAGEGKLSGTTTLMLASKPDSVVGHATWEATKAP